MIMSIKYVKYILRRYWFSIEIFIRREWYYKNNNRIRK